jgi:hypothetical protein
LGTPRAKRNIVFAGATLIRMAFNGEGIAVVGLQPARLLLQGDDRLRRQIGLVALEEHPVADIDHEILLAPGLAALAIAPSAPRFLLAQAPIDSATASTAANFNPWRIRI